MSWCECPTCGDRFPSTGRFDEHLLAVHEPRPVVRAWRRTSKVTTGPDTVELCEPECRDEFLLDLGLKGSGGGSAFPRSGATTVHMAWNRTDYAVSWQRQPRGNSRYCDLCGQEWRFRAAVRRHLAPVSAERRAELTARLGRHAAGRAAV